jgi:hypothetical protein
MKKIIIILALSFLTIESHAINPKLIINTGLGDVNKPVNSTNYVTTKKIDLGISNEVYKNKTDSIVIATLYSVDIYNNKKVIEDIKWLVSLKKTFKPKHAVFIGGNLSIPLYVDIDNVKPKTPGYGIHMGYNFKSNNKINYKLLLQLHQYKTNYKKNLVNQSITAGITYSI